MRELAANNARFISSSIGPRSMPRQLKRNFRPQNLPYADFELRPDMPSTEAILVNRIKSELKKMLAL